MEDDTEARVQRLSHAEVHRLVYKYIGVNQGYLGDFSYQSHHEFYILLDLEIDPNEYPGTTRQRFMTILHQSPANVQARILEGVLERYPVGSSGLRTQELHDEIRRWIDRLRTGRLVEAPTVRLTSDAVQRALSDAERLLSSGAAVNAVDRIHTALHGYLRLVCDEAGILSRQETPA
ncbi:unnamed protein product [marine sediment metagenome]|uniref:Uncharacterized protein n=1 Tax=marine sediment metagenome TaxID=412755 RepID=X0SAM9_9ZZZZ